LDKDIKVEEIVEEDKQAILMFLRNTAFGSEYQTTLIDPKTKVEFEHTVDLSELNFKEFNLTPNEKGEYIYTLPKSKDVVTFKFLNTKQEDELTKIEENWAG